MKKIYFVAFIILNVIGVKAQWVADTNVRNVICNLSGGQNQPRICSDAHGGAIMCWADGRGVRSRIYAQRIDQAGYIKWAANGVAVSDTNLTVTVYNPEITVDSSGGAIICYETYEASDRIFAVRIDSMGNSVWPSPVIIDLGDARGPAICTDEKGGAIISWHRYVTGGGGVQVFVQWIDKTGNVHLPVNGLQITYENPAHYHCHAAYAGDSSAYVLYSDYDTLRLVRFDSTGAIPWSNPVTLTNSFTNNEGDYFIRGHSEGNHHAYVFWKDTMNASAGLYAQQIDANGTQLWNVGGNAVDTPFAGVDYLSVTSDSSGGDYVSYGSSPVRVQRMNVNGQRVFNPAAKLCSSGGETTAIIKNDGHTGAIITWQDARGDNGVYAQRIDSSGNLLWRNCGTPVYTKNNSGTNNDMHAIANNDGTGIAVFLYGQSDVYCAKVENIVGIGIDELNVENGMEVFPNPSKGSLSVKLGNGNQLPATITLTDVLGREVSTHILCQRTTIIRLPQTGGIYFLTLRAIGKSVVRRIVVE